jgi:hypothetical protein
MSPRRPAFLRLSVMRDIIATLFPSQRPPKNTGYWLRLTVILKARDRKVSTTVSLGAPMTYSCSILSESRQITKLVSLKHDDLLSTYILSPRWGS